MSALRKEREDAQEHRCPALAEGNRCIYESGHDGNHFAKDSFSYFIWAGDLKRPRPEGAA